MAIDKEKLSQVFRHNKFKNSRLFLIEGNYEGIDEKKLEEILNKFEETLNNLKNAIGTEQVENCAQVEQVLISTIEAKAWAIRGDMQQKIENGVSTLAECVEANIEALSKNANAHFADLIAQIQAILKNGKNVEARLNALYTQAEADQEKNYNLLRDMQNSLHDVQSRLKKLQTSQNKTNEILTELSMHQGTDHTKPSYTNSRKPTMIVIGIVIAVLLVSAVCLVIAFGQKWFEKDPGGTGDVLQGDDNTYTITFVTNGGTTVAPMSYNKNSLTAPPASPTKNGYNFGGWTFDDASFAFGNTMPTHNVVATAIWNYKTVTYDSGESDKRIDASNEYDHDSFNIADLSVFMKQGYKLQFSVSLYMKEENEGYQEIYLRNTHGANIAGNAEFAHGGSGTDGWGWEYFTFTVEGEKCTNTMFLRYGAHGKYSDDWIRKRAVVTVKVIPE